jgi:hypothetical protein
MNLHGQLLPIRFMRYVCADIKYEFYRINTPSNTCDWSIKYWKDIESVLILSNLCFKQMHGKKWEQIRKKWNVEWSFQ